MSATIYRNPSVQVRAIFARAHTGRESNRNSLGGWFHKAPILVSARRRPRLQEGSRLQHPRMFQRHRGRPPSPAWPPSTPSIPPHTATPPSPPPSSLLPPPLGQHDHRRIGRRVERLPTPITAQVLPAGNAYPHELKKELGCRPRAARDRDGEPRDGRDVLEIGLDDGRVRVELDHARRARVRRPHARRRALHLLHDLGGARGGKCKEQVSVISIYLFSSIARPRRFKSGHMASIRARLPMFSDGSGLYSTLAEGPG
ncbi:hypothetical protein GY45DRAFT_965494 [Cubamyces sp. BRFM 1775]|nr:hypothetical protein GY45DRAFT_965494 [Cubamyces sp. BRFM 1775]